MRVRLRLRVRVRDRDRDRVRVRVRVRVCVTASVRVRVRVRVRHPLAQQHRLERRAHAHDRVERHVGRHVGRGPVRLQHAVAVDGQRPVGEHGERDDVARLERLSSG